MTSPAGDGSDKPQTWSAGSFGAFSGPARGAQGGGAAEKPGPGEVLPPEDRKAAMISLDAQRGQVRSAPSCWRPSPASPSPPTSSPPTRSPKQGRTHRRRPRRRAPRGRHPRLLRHRLRRPVEAQADARHLLPLPDRLRLHPLHRDHRVRLHPPRRLAHVAGLAPQQVRLHQREGVAREAAAGREGEPRKRGGRNGTKATKGAKASTHR